MQAAASKRKVFNSSKQRVTNEAANAAHSGLNTVENGQQPEKRGRASNWRTQSQSLRSMLRAAKTGAPDVMPIRDGM